MNRYDRRFRMLAAGLSALAGFVDAVGFVISSGLFVSFMSGNSTRLAVALATGRLGFALLAAGLVVAFLAGVVSGALLAPIWSDRRKTLVLSLTAVALFAAAGLASVAHPAAGVLALAFAMGLLNNTFLRDGEVSIGLTYMTGTLVRAGQRMAGAISGKGPTDWQPYILLWVGLVLGAGAGAVLAVRAPPAALWCAGGGAAMMALAANRLERARS